MARLFTHNPIAAAKAGPPMRVILPGTNYHRIRKTVHLVCTAIFILLPLLNVMRFDIPKQRFYLFGTELWISEFAILFFSLMFLLFLVAASAMLYGRIYCSYLCPQMIFSEAASSLESALRRWTNRTFSGLAPAARRRIAKAIFFAVLWFASIFLAFIFISYFVEPRDLLRRLLAFDVRTAGGIAGAATTLLTLLDFAFLRQRFCTTVCPYGYLQGILADRNTLLVQYRDENRQCIQCSRCVRVCPMGIDIRNSAHQIECTHCAECIDACSEILGRLGKRSLVHYAWGETGEVVGEERSWLRRIGLRDGKRLAVLLVLLFYASGLYVAIAMRQPVLLHLAPDRTTLYSIDADQQVRNHFRLQASNRGKVAAHVTLAVEGLPGAKLLGLDPALMVKPGESVEVRFDIAASPQVATGVTYVRLVAHVTPDQTMEPIPMTFIGPMDSATSPDSSAGDRTGGVAR